MTQNSNWGRNYGRVRKCNRRRTAPTSGNRVYCTQRDGHRTDHRGPEDYTAPRKYWTWGHEPAAPLKETD